MIALMRRLLLMTGLCLALPVLAQPSTPAPVAPTDGFSKPAIHYHGAIGLGSWNTAVEYKDIVVTSNGVVLYRSDFAHQGTNGWRVYSGNWTVQQGACRQSEPLTPGIAATGNTNWANYTLELKARKISGDEGFLIFLNWLDETNFHCFNVGGWQNTVSAFQQSVNGRVTTGEQVPQQVETNVWYDIRVVVSELRIECYVDSTLISVTSYAAPEGSGRHGKIGLGTWRTAAEYKDIVVTSKGVRQYRSDFEHQGTNNWRFYSGDWMVNDGTLHQTAEQPDCRAIMAGKDWANYTLTLKARKLDGEEGFRVIINWLDNNNWTVFNVGGWTNTSVVIDQDLNGARMNLTEFVPRRIETNVWYDLMVVVDGPKLACYLNTKLIVSAQAFTIISTNAVYLGCTPQQDNSVLQFQIGGNTFQGYLPVERGAPPKLEKGSLVQVSGIGRGLTRPAGRQPETELGFEMVLASPDDVVLLQAPPWLNPERLFLIGGISCGVLLVGVAWIAMISRKNRLLKLAQLELKKANEELEMRVRRRTADLAQANAELGHEQALLRTLLETASDFIYFKDASSRFVRCSRSICLRFGLAHEQLVGKTDFDLYLEEHARQAFEEEQQILRTGQPLIGKQEMEVHVDGVITWVMTTKMPWRDQTGTIIGTFGISRDMTSTKQAEEQLAETHRQLVDASRKAGQAEVAAGVLHNVGNVLNSVNISVNLLRDRFRGKRFKNLAKAVALLRQHQTDLSAYLSNDPRGVILIPYLERLANYYTQEEDRLFEETRSLAENVNHISKIVAMQQNYANSIAIVETINLAELVESALKIQFTGPLSGSARPVREFDPLPEIVADKHKILQILVNLLQNAKHACAGQPSEDSVITVRLRRNGEDRVCVEVRDNGMGIAPENLARLFTQGFTTRKNGHGLGLHSAALAAKQMGGDLQGFSEGPGKGAWFVLELPIKSAASQGSF
jgi:PAS domain S-box-containing protein